MRDSRRFPWNSKSTIIRAESRIAELMKENLTLKACLNETQKRLQELEDSNERLSERTLDQISLHLKGGSSQNPGDRGATITRTTIQMTQVQSLDESMLCSEQINLGEGPLLPKFEAIVLMKKMQKIENILKFSAQMPVTEESIPFFVELPRRLVYYIETESAQLPDTQTEASQLVRQLAQESAHQYVLMQQLICELNRQLEDCLTEIKGYQEELKSVLLTPTKLQTLAGLECSNGNLVVPQPSANVEKKQTSKSKLSSILVPQAGTHAHESLRKVCALEH